MAQIHAKIEIRGIVQGVGFRPFVHRCAQELGLCGYVRNTSSGAEIVLEGTEEKIDAFLKKLSQTAPSRARIELTKAQKSNKLCGYVTFEIIESKGDSGNNTLISPDIAICDDCLRELFDENDRRYKYPFINCTNCGPRFTITKDIPYDRVNTTMAGFTMCPDCNAEYNDITHRRYHAQPDCCEMCGPEFCFAGKRGDDAINSVRERIKDGEIIAVKGIGGYHITCRTDEVTVSKLRERKRRDEKPFAIMCRDIKTAKRFAKISEAEERHLTCHARPIVLLKKRDARSLLHISGNGYIGIMLPYAPIHYLLLDETLDAVVMTSANIADLPIIHKDAEAKRELCKITDGILINNREIYTRCDDSLMWVHNGHEYFVRRSRGYAPAPIALGEELDDILACGAEQKASFALAKGRNVFLSQHIGDLKNIESLSNYEEQIEHFKRIFGIVPKKIVCDMHPNYMSTEYASNSGLRIFRAQHHHAHMASCMADNSHDGKCIGIIWDGTGYGTDGKMWGGEFLVGDYKSFRRCGTIREIVLAGGDVAIREVSRIKEALCYDAGLDADERIVKIINSGINCPRVTGMGRLFDGVSAMLGIVNVASYEGQAASLLEAMACDGILRTYPYEIENGDMYIFDYRKMICAISEDMEKNVAVSEIAAAFMNTIVLFAADIACRIREDTGIEVIALSGGSFQNMYILKQLEEKLSAKGFKVLTHRQVSTNDEGIALGQIMIAQRGEE